jgi:hypothetical protein
VSWSATPYQALSRWRFRRIISAANDEAKRMKVPGSGTSAIGSSPINCAWMREVAQAGEEIAEAPACVTVGHSSDP